MTRSSFSGLKPRPWLLAAAFALALAGCNKDSTVATAEPAAAEDQDAQPVAMDDAGSQTAGEATAPAAPATLEDVDSADDADEDEAGPAQLAQFGGAAAASAELCGKPYDAAALVTMKEKQKQLYVATGGDPSQYEADFQAGYARGKADFQAVGADQRQQFCGRIDSWR